MTKLPLLFSYVLCITFALVQPGHCFQKESRYATIIYNKNTLLSDFNDELYLGRSLNRMIRKKSIVTVADEVLAKIDIIIEKAEVVLDMFPDNLHITLVLLPDEDAVARVYKSKYGENAGHIAYYSLAEKTIYISVDDTNLRVFAHEVGHAIVDHYFEVRPPYTIHELMAQFTEKHITD